MTFRKIWLRQEFETLGFPKTFTRTFTLGSPKGRGSRLGYNVICPVHGKSSTFSAFKGASNVELLRAAVTLLKSNKKFLATLAECSRCFEGSYNRY